MTLQSLPAGSTLYKVLYLLNHKFSFVKNFLLLNLARFSIGVGRKGNNLLRAVSARRSDIQTMGRPSKQKNRKCKNKGYDKTPSQPVVKKETSPLPILEEEEESPDSDHDEVLYPKSEYNITFTTRGRKLIGTIYWKVGKYYDFKSGVRYTCRLPCEEAKCCSVWQLCVKKCLTFVYMGLVCYINDRSVTFSVLLGDKTLKTSPLLTVEATEQLNGRYSGELPNATLERYKDELTHDFFTLKCQVVLNLTDMTRSDYPHDMCSCSKLTDDFEALYVKGDLPDVTLKVGGHSFPSHACILAARSPVFLEFFQRDDESCEKTCKFLIPLFQQPVITGDTFGQVMRYIYSGTTLPLSVDTAISLFYLSTALAMRNLRRKCRHFLQMKLSKENFLKIHSVAVLRSSKRLRSATEAFFLKNEDLMESINSEDGSHLVAPPFVTEEQFETIKASLKELSDKCAS